jgi:ribosome maturation factor RimP
VGRWAHFFFLRAAQGGLTGAAGKVDAMSRMRQQLMALLEPAIEALGYELVDLEVNIGPRRGLIRLYIDFAPGHGPKTPLPQGAPMDASGIALEDCELVSRQVTGVLEVEDAVRADYNLEVSSPGLDRKLTKPAHFDRFAGKAVKGRLRQPVEGRRRFTGRLLRRDGERIHVAVDGAELALDLADIEVVRLVPEI